MTFKPSVYQQAVFDAVESTNQNLIVEAVAGSGKTTTILQALTRIMNGPRRPRFVTFIAFNKSIADELQARVPEGVRAKTFNSLGAGALFKQIGRAELDAKKTWLLMDWYGHHFPAAREALVAYGSQIAKLVGLAKQAGIGVLRDYEYGEFRALADHHDLEFDGSDIFVTEAMTERYERAPNPKTAKLQHIEYVGDPSDPIDCARNLLFLSNDAVSRCGLIDFDDQLYIPILWDLKFFSQDIVFVDEAQDVNAIQRAILKKLDGRRGRLIAVGDSRQAIYGFRGADVDALDLIQMEFNAKKLPLSICYRCSKAVIREAQKIVPHIEPFENAPEGSVEWRESEPYQLGWFNPGDAVLCRNTGPLVELAFRLMGAGVGVTIRGRDIAKGLIKMVERFNATDLETLETKLYAYYEAEKTRLIEREEFDKADRLEDQVNALLVIIGHVHYYNDIKPTLEEMFSDNGRGQVQLSTCHKSKGLEWDKVFILDAWLMPSQYAKKEWQLRQEYNLAYVAWTRAKKDLVFVVSPRDEDE